MEYFSVDRILIGYEKILLCIIIVDRVIYCVVCELDEVRYGIKGNLTVIKSLICIFIKQVRGINPTQEGIYTYVTSTNSQIQNSIFSLIVYLYLGLRKVLLMVIWLNCTCGNIVLGQIMEYNTAAFCMGIIRSYVG